MIEAPSLWALVEARAAATPDALFAVDERDRRMTFGEYRDAALRCAAGLQVRGARVDTNVSWMLPTRLEALVLVAALARLGAVQNPILPIYREREVGFVVRETRARMLVVPDAFRGFDHEAMARGVAAESVVSGALADLSLLVVRGSLPEGDPTALPAWREDAGEPVRWIFYTSGTTADPKGARHGDASIAAFAAGMSRALDLHPDDRVALVFPLTHVGGIGWLFAGLMAGCAHIAVESFDASATPRVLARHGVTQATAGTAFHQAYLAAQRSHGSAPLFPHVRTFPGGGAPKPPQLHFDVKREMGGAGIVSGYGMTECPILAMNRWDDADEKLAHTEGRPCPPDVEIRVVKGDGTRAAPGEEGEIRVRGPQLFRGYQDARLDVAAFDSEGFFRTGDLGALDADGYVAITGRTKDVIIRKGENISAQELENLLFEHERVAEVAVVGLPDPERGERVCAVVVPADPAAPLTMGDMTAFLRAAKLMPQKIPEQLETLPELPRNATGKVLKESLRARFADA